MHGAIRIGCAFGLWLGLIGAGLDDTRSALPPPSPRLLHVPKDALFVDDFSSGTLAAWRPDHPELWSVVRGMACARLPDRKQVRSMLFGGDTTWTDVAIDLDVCMTRGVDKGVAVRVLNDHGIGVDLRGGDYQDLVVYQGAIPLGRVRSLNADGAWHHLRVELREMHVRVLVNGDVTLERDARAIMAPRGGIALPAYTGGVGLCTVYYDNVVVTPLD